MEGKGIERKERGKKGMEIDIKYMDYTQFELEFKTSKGLKDLCINIVTYVSDVLAVIKSWGLPKREEKEVMMSLKLTYKMWKAEKEVLTVG